MYAFEPDEESYQKCIMVKQETGFEEVEILPYGLWHTSGQLSFQAEGTGSSMIRDDGQNTVEVHALDDVISRDEHITFIKMDIEGAELKALQGAQRIIRDDRPKMAISIYHKPEDWIEIPDYIMSLTDGYAYYFRHYENRLMETVFYAVPKEEQ